MKNHSRIGNIHTFNMGLLDSLEHLATGFGQKFVNKYINDLKQI